MRIRALGALLLPAVIVASACSIPPAGLFRQYEYEEDVHLSLDGSATVYVNSSVAAFNALHGTSIDPAMDARIEEDLRKVFDTAATRVTRLPRPTRRNGRRYLHVRVEAPDVRRLSEAQPFAWSSYEFRQEASRVLYRQVVGPPAAPVQPAPTGWQGAEIAAFRLHLPSRITFHNSAAGPQRGNILVWEQPLGDRLSGVPVILDVRMESRSILSNTLRLFGGALAAAAAAFAAAIWWVMRRGRSNPA